MRRWKNNRPKTDVARNTAVNPPSDTTTPRRLTPGMLSTASTGVMPTPAVMALKDGSLFEAPDSTALSGCGANGSFKAIEILVQGSPTANKPLNAVAGKRRRERSEGPLSARWRSRGRNEATWNSYPGMNCGQFNWRVWQFVFTRVKTALATARDIQVIGRVEQNSSRRCDHSSPVNTRV